MKRDAKGNLILSNGNRVYANRGIIGISHELDGISEGYDGGITGLPGQYQSSLSVNDQLEIVDYAVGLWEQYRQKLLAIGRV